MWCHERCRRLRDIFESMASPLGLMLAAKRAKAEANSADDE